MIKIKTNLHKFSIYLKRSKIKIDIKYYNLFILYFIIETNNKKNQTKIMYRLTNLIIKRFSYNIRTPFDLKLFKPDTKQIIEKSL